MKNNIKSFFSGVVFTLVFCIAVLPIFADTRSISVFYNNIRMTLNGRIIETDQEPFILNGRTFVPIRFVAEAFNKEVKYNETTDTVEITDKVAVTGTKTQPNVPTVTASIPVTTPIPTTAPDMFGNNPPIPAATPAPTSFPYVNEYGITVTTSTTRVYEPSTYVWYTYFDNPDVCVTFDGTRYIELIYLDYMFASKYRLLYDEKKNCANVSYLHHDATMGALYEVLKDNIPCITKETQWGMKHYVELDYYKYNIMPLVPIAENATILHSACGYENY